MFENSILIYSYLWSKISQDIPFPREEYSRKVGLLSRNEDADTWKSPLRRPRRRQWKKAAEYPTPSADRSSPRGREVLGTVDWLLGKRDDAVTGVDWS